jgi:predicted nucleic acid-binding protein
VSFLLDTNVVSEWVKPHPEPKVAAWLAALDEDTAFISVMSFAEIARGIELLPRGQRRQSLADWLGDDLPNRFDGRIIGIDLRIASAWGRLMVHARSRGASLGAIDGFIAASADVFGLTLATRNTRDFASFDIPLLNPWEDH